MGCILGLSLTGLPLMCSVQTTFLELSLPLRIHCLFPSLYSSQTGDCSAWAKSGPIWPSDYVAGERQRPTSHFIAFLSVQGWVTLSQGREVRWDMPSRGGSWRELYPGDENVLHLDLGGDYTGVHTWKSAQSCAFEICAFCWGELYLGSRGKGLIEIKN